jgi:hypothetical protein
VFGYVDVSLSKEPSREVGLWKMSTENLCLSICMKVARTVARAANWEEAMRLPKSQLETGVLNEAPSYSKKSENPIKCNKPDVLITQAYDSATVPIT